MTATTTAEVTASGTAPEAGRRPSRRLLLGLAVATVVLVAGLAMPSVVADAYTMGLAVEAALLGLLALGIGFLARHLGLISLGHTAFFGGAAYAVGIAVNRWGWDPLPSVLFGVLVGTVIAVLMGVLVVRASGMGFLMLTLALSQALYQLCVQTAFRPLTGAYDGLLIGLDADSSFVGLSPADLQDPGRFWPVVWVPLAVGLVVVWLVGRSRFGTTLEGIRENEERMRFSGYNTFLPRLAAFVLSGLLASLGGALFALNAAYVSPDLLGFAQAGDSLIAAMVGGLGTLAGPLVGTALYVWGESRLNSGANLPLYTGVALIVVLVFLPGGITGTLQRLWKRVKR
ncbi:branched-chain amino acid transport system permease protein [Parafrankia irregularis]|uniref:Branched-chain amino acid transport system permease protein n=1 Tax=Parafrankia irregularis TaxID=795642 RepID=A0A0S4QLQ5_9ACTN|nr:MULTISPECIES: branched-chain amino acid ABC transporter permease [Parafrankia]MBE3200271.1 branched-chain amino acid ABC transporter permease [Parafrankia sp. CH37]CUU56529.1 branched-chain amino acid transport system permease protein [Parafrankia irregularis]